LSKIWAVILMILLNHTLIQSAMADLHVSQFEHSQFESPHIHLDRNASHQSADEAPDAGEHQKTAHIHFHCDLNETPVSLAESVSISTPQHLNYKTGYLGLSYQPAVPPPNA